MKLASALSEIDSLKEEVHLSQSEVASLTKWVETFNDHQKLAVEALEMANKENITLKEHVRELDPESPA